MENPITGIFFPLDILNFDGPNDIGGAAPVNTEAPEITGTNRVGEELSTTDGAWTGDPAPTFTYQWRRGGINIGSATDSTYVLVIADIGQDIDCVVTATNIHGEVSQDSNIITLSAFLDAVLASAEFDVDATLAASYSGSGAWQNGIALPASGAAENAYDLTLAGDMALSGTPGDPAAYMLLDGSGDYAQIAANTPFIQNMIKTTGGSAFWVAFAWRHVDGSTKVNFATNPAVGSRGARLQSTAGESLQFQQRGDAANIAHTIGNLTNGTDYLVIMSIPAGGGTVRHWLSTTTKTETAMTYDTTSDNPTGLLTIGAESDGGAALPDATRLYHVSMGNAYIDDAQAAAIFAALEARHARDYTP